MAKIIKLKESDLENIVKRVLAEQGEVEMDRKSFRDTKKSYVKTGKPKELPKGQNPKEEKVKAELKSC